MTMTRASRLRRCMTALLHAGPERVQAPVPEPAAGFVPAGHYYSPLPGPEDVDRLERTPASAEPLPGIRLDPDEQMALLDQLAAFYPSMPFRPEQTPGFRYRLDNPS